ncbi:MAG: membrane protease subunit (stomatin/prohibitin family) [Paracoccaceae bacterium]|jgi:membrane protease subunit (stomatin/prohibitin family)
MSIFDFLGGQFVDVIEWTDDTRDTLVWRFERHGNEIKYGAKLTVREGQAAVFVHEGQLADVFTPGMWLLETNNLPIMTSLQHWDHGFKSPFKSEVYFVNTTRFQDMRWGTRNPIMLRDPEFGPVRLRAFGTYTLRITDPALFLREIVGTDGEFTTDEISEQIRNIIIARFSNAIAEAQIPVLDIAASTDQLGDMIRARIAPELAAYGIETPALTVENVSLPESVEKALDKRTSMGVIGNLDAYAKFQAAEAMEAAAKNPGGGGGMGAGLGMGMGIAAGQAMGAALGGMHGAPHAPAQSPWGAHHGAQGYGQAPQAPTHVAPPPPPPPAIERVWHLAKNGVTTGPFSRADLGRMVTSGGFARETMVWSAGYEGWMQADDAPELAQLFTIMPPPPPPA